MLAAGAAQNQSRAAVLDDCLRLSCSVSTGDLGNRLEAKDAAATEFSQARERVLQPVDGAERVELVHHEPQPLIVLRAIECLKDREPHPGRDDRAQRRDLRGAVRNEQHPLSGLHPLAHREAARPLRLQKFQRGGRGAGDRANRAEHSRVLRFEKRLRRRAGHQPLQLRVAGHRQETPQLAAVPAAAFAAAARHGAEEGACIAAPFARRRIIARWYQAAHELLDVPGRTDLGERIPFNRQRLERIEDHVAATSFEQARAVAAVRVGNDRAIAARQRPRQQIRNGGRFARTGRADQFEVARLLALLKSHARELQCAGAQAAPLGAARV